MFYGMLRIKNKVLFYVLIAASLLLALLYSPIGSPYYYTTNEEIPVYCVDFSKGGIANLPKNSTVNVTDGAEMNLPQVSETGNSSDPVPNTSRVARSTNQGTTSSFATAGRRSVYISTKTSTGGQSGGVSLMAGGGGLGVSNRNSVASSSFSTSANFGSPNFAFNKRDKKDDRLSSDVFSLLADETSITSLDEYGLRKGPGLPDPPPPAPPVPIPDTLLFFFFLLVVYFGVIFHRKHRLIK
jgi:hypothetical protein